VRISSESFSSVLLLLTPVLLCACKPRTVSHPTPEEREAYTKDSFAGRPYTEPHTGLGSYSSVSKPLSETMRTLLFLLIFAGLAHAVTLTHYGSSSDLTGDPLSAPGVGNHNNTLVPLQSAALSDSVAQSYGISLGQSFSVTTSSGQTYNLIYADTVPATYQG
jgi:hypothetical protein